MPTSNPHSWGVSQWWILASSFLPLTTQDKLTRNEESLGCLKLRSHTLSLAAAEPWYQLLISSSQWQWSYSTKAGKINQTIFWFQASGESLRHGLSMMWYRANNDSVLIQSPWWRAWTAWLSFYLERAVLCHCYTLGEMWNISSFLQKGFVEEVLWKDLKIHLACFQWTVTHIIWTMLLAALRGLTWMQVYPAGMQLLSCWYAPQEPQKCCSKEKLTSLGGNLAVQAGLVKSPLKELS